MTYKFKIENDCLSEITHFDAVSGNKNVYDCEFEIACNEDGAVWFAVFKEGDAVYIAPVSDGKCSIPYEILEHAGCAYIGCYAECGENKRISTNWLPIKIDEGAYSEGTAPLAPSEELWETLLRNSVPVIGENGNWFTYDMQEGRYEDTGFSARGAQGPQGPKGDKGDTGDYGNSVILSVLFKSPKNFGKSQNGAVGDNIKVYRDYTDETFVFVGSGEMYDGIAHSDSYLYECGTAGGDTMRYVCVGEGISTIGKYVFNRSRSASFNTNVKNRSSNWATVGTVVKPVILPKSIISIGERAFQYNQMADTIIINSEGSLNLGNQAFVGSSFATVEIPNASAITYSSNTFTDMAYLKEFSISCELATSISFKESSLLSADSLVNIANHLKTIGFGETAQTLTLHNTAKTLCTNTLGTVSDGVFTKATGGNTTLTDFIENTKGWTIA